jgi:hypothetical protein
MPRFELESALQQAPTQLPQLRGTHHYARDYIENNIKQNIRQSLPATKKNVFIFNDSLT